MRANIFSVLMTILWSSVLITLFSFLRTRTKLLHICSISTVILIYLFCAIRLAFPFEVPWAHVVSGGAVYNGMYRALRFKTGPVRIYEILFAAWFIGMLINLALYSVQYRRAMRHFLDLPQEESRMGQEILYEMDRNSRIKVLESAGVKGLRENLMEMFQEIGLSGQNLLDRVDEVYGKMCRPSHGDLQFSLNESSEEAMAAVKELAQKAVRLEDVVIDPSRARDLMQAAQEYQEYKA